VIRGCCEEVETRGDAGACISHPSFILLSILSPSSVLLSSSSNDFLTLIPRHLRGATACKGTKFRATSSTASTARKRTQNDRASRMMTIDTSKGFVCLPPPPLHPFLYHCTITDLLNCVVCWSDHYLLLHLCKFSCLTSDRSPTC
jgi:hypothetical protein